MAIYDPLAALAVAMPYDIDFSYCDVEVSTSGETYGATRINAATTSSTRIVSKARIDLPSICLEALTTEALYAARQ